MIKMAEIKKDGIELSYWYGHGLMDSYFCSTTQMIKGIYKEKEVCVFYTTYGFGMGSYANWMGSFNNKSLGSKASDVYRELDKNFDHKNFKEDDWKKVKKEKEEVEEEIKKNKTEREKRLLKLEQERKREEKQFKKNSEEIRKIEEKTLNDFFLCR